MTKKIIIILIIVAISFAGTRNIMPNRREMNQVEIVRIMGIDRTADGRVEVTLVRNYANTELGGAIGETEEGADGEENQAGGGEEAASAADPPSSANTISRIGETVSSAISNLRRGMEREVLTSHIEYILIGEDAVKSDIAGFMDFLSRDIDARLSAGIYVVKDSSAKDFLNSMPEGFILADKLSNFGRNSGVSAISSEITLADFLRKLTSGSGDGIIPTVSISEQDEQMSVTLGGYAIIANEKFAGFMDENAAGGFNLITETSSAGGIALQYRDNYVSIQVSDFRTRVTFDFQDSELRAINIITVVDANVNERHGRVDLTSREVVAELEMLASQHFKQQMSSAIELSQNYRSDFLGFGEMIRLRHPYRWERLQSNWRTTLATISINIIVNTQIAQAYSIL